MAAPSNNHTDSTKGFRYRRSSGLAKAIRVIGSSNAIGMTWLTCDSYLTWLTGYPWLMRLTRLTRLSMISVMSMMSVMSMIDVVDRRSVTASLTVYSQVVTQASISFGSFFNSLTVA